MAEAGRIPLEAALVRVWRGDVVVGAGALVGPRQVLTAAHVVAGPGGEAPGGPVELDFPLVAPGHRLVAGVAAWEPLRDDRTGDVAGLRLTVDPPPGARPLVLAAHRGPPGPQLITVGFPERLELGSWAYARPAGAVATGWIELHSEPGRETALAPGFSGAPVWDPRADAAVGMVVQRVTGAPPKIGYMLPVRRLLAAWPELAGIIERTPPFLGLRPFTEHDTALFFGREELTDRLVAHARRAPVVSVIGPSGVGKSSLLLAGVLPRLRADGTAVAVLRPSDAGTPLRALALAVDRLLAPDRDPLDRVDEVTALAGRLARGELLDVAAALGRRLVVAVDQFEEVFAGPEPDRAAFTRALRTGPGVSVLLNLRDTFLGASLRTPATAALAASWLPVTVGELGPRELRRVLTKPLAGVGTVGYEQGLVERILDDVQSAPGALPLLQFALTELWERRSGGLLTHAAYDALGGVRGALAGYAESVWDSLEPPARAAGERLLVQLVRPLPDELLTVRRTAPRTELDEAQWTVAQRLATSRLLVLRTAPDAGVELAHESLAAGWRRLAELAAEHRDFRLWQEGLRQRRARWLAEDNAPRRLPTGADLRDAARYARERPGDLSAGEHEYVAAGLRRRRTRALRAGAAALVLVVAIALTYRSTGEQRSELAARDLAASAERLRGDDRFGSVQLALRAERTDPEADTSRSWPSGLAGVDKLVPDYFSETSSLSLPSAVPTPADWVAQDTAEQSGRVSADGKALVTEDPAGHGALWHLGADGGVTRDAGFDTLFGRGDQLVEAAISRSGRYVGYVARLQATLPGEPGGPVDDDGLPLPVPDAKPTCDLPSVASIASCVVAYDAVEQRVVFAAPVAGVIPPVTAISFDPGDTTMGYVVSNATIIDAPSTVVNTLHEVDLPSGRERPARTLGWHSFVYGLWLGPGAREALVVEFLPRPGERQYGRGALARVRLGEASPVREELVGVMDRIAVSLDFSTVAVSQVPEGGGGEPVLVFRSWAGGPVLRIPALSDAAQHGAPALTADGSTLVVAERPDLPMATATDIRDLNEETRTVVTAWTVPGGERRDTGFALPTGWRGVVPLGGLDGPVLLLNGDVTGYAAAGGGRPAPLRRITQGPGAAVTPDRLCALLAGPENDSAVRDLVPKDAYQGELCPS